MSVAIGCRVNVNVNARNYTQSDQCEKMARAKEHLKNVEKKSRKEAKEFKKKQVIEENNKRRWPRHGLRHLWPCRVLYPV